MVRSLGRIVLGYVAACVVAGATQSAFVIDPATVAASPETLAAAALLVAMAATQTAVFSLPFAAIGIPLTEWLGWRGWLTFVLLATAIALAGLATAMAGEGVGATLRNGYALRAFLATGLAGGLAYWLISGRWAGSWASTAAEPIVNNERVAVTGR